MKKYFSMLVILISLISISNVFAQHSATATGNVTWTFNVAYEVIEPLSGGESQLGPFDLLVGSTIYPVSDTWFMDFTGTQGKAITHSWSSTATTFNNGIAEIELEFGTPSTSFDVNGMAYFDLKILSIKGLAKGSFTYSNTLTISYDL